MYPAEQHGKVGNIALSSTKLEFVSVGSSAKPLIIKLSEIRGVKKSGLLGGLIIRYRKWTDGGQVWLGQWTGRVIRKVDRLEISNMKRGLLSHIAKQIIFS